MACAQRLGPLPPLAALAVAAVLLLAAAGCPAGAAKLERKGAKITLQAKWQGTPLLHEAAEFLVSVARRAWAGAA